MTDRWILLHVYDRRTDEWTQEKNVLLSHALTIRGSDVASLVEF